MAYRSSCNHFTNLANITDNVVKSKEPLVCADCDYAGPHLWICLQRNCLKIGCSENANDHNTLHNVAQPSHAIHLNLSTNRLWCYKCKSEVFLDANNKAYDSDAENESFPLQSLDSGHGSYSTLRTNSPDKQTNMFNFDSVGLNVAMNSGDASESSDNEDDLDYSMDKPMGLVGLQNIGNTCYMNAALQALSNTEPLTKFFLDCGLVVQLLSDGRKPGLSRTYLALMRDIWLKRNGGYVTPSGILYGIRTVHPMFRGYHQHDTQEFLRNFMDQLHEELKQVAPPEPASSSEDTFSLAMEEPTFSSSYDSSEGEYETCDSGVSERSSLSDDTERPSTSSSTKRRLSRCGSPNRRQRQRLQSVIDSQPSTSTAANINAKKQIKYRSIISDIFDGKLLSSVQCLTCNRVSSKVETFQDLSLPIPSRDHLVLLHGRPTSPTSTCSEAVLPVQDGWISWIVAWLRSWFYGPTVTLHDCLAAFFSTDELKGDNMYSCEKCNKLRNGIKFSKVLQLPEILCIHLKRIRHELMFSSKISSAVSFPLKGLDMRPYLHSDCVSKVSNYELFSVICHHGTAGAGHYISYALNCGQWFEFDDQCVTRVTAEKVQSSEAYVLFYRKNNNAADVIRKKVHSMLSETCSNEVALISKQWINKFNYCAEPGPIDNSDFLCQHGAINPERSQFMDQLAIRIPYEVYDFLHKKFGGAAQVKSISICPICQNLQKRLLLERETLIQISREAQSQEVPNTHYLSSSWYTQWQHFIQRNSQEPPGPIDNSKINLNQLDYTEAAEVPECIWNFFFNIYGGGPEIRIQSNNLIRTDSCESMDTTYAATTSQIAQSDDDNETVPMVNGTECGEQAKNEVSEPQFVIPNLKTKSANSSTAVIDKSFYSHGEPEDDKTNGEAKLCPANPTPNGFMNHEATEVQNEEVSKQPIANNEATDEPKCNSDKNTELDEEEEVKVKPNKRHRRRRRAVRELSSV